MSILAAVLGALALVVLNILVTAGTFHHSPRPVRRTIEVTGVQSNGLSAGYTSSLTSLPYVVLGRGSNIIDAVSDLTARTIRGGGAFTCTITQPVGDQIPRAADCRAARRGVGASEH